VITCAELPVAAEAGLIGGGALTGSSADAIVSDQRSVNQNAVDLARSFGLPIQVSGETLLGAPAHALVAAAADTDVVVVGATSHPGRLSDVLGSVATAVAHRAKGPVVVVHGHARPDHEIRRIAVGVDGSAGATTAVQWAIEEAIRCEAELVLVHGWIYPYQGLRSGVSEPRDEMKLDAMRTLEGCAARVRALAPTVRCHSIISEQSPAKAVLDEARTADLVVVGSRGHGGFTSMLLGSVSRTVLQHSPVPVAVIRQND
jgi:nucleotide-binding universal stress UspA family protein